MLKFGDYPSVALLHSRAEAQGCEEGELLFLARRVPGRIRQWFPQRPDVFRALAECKGKTLDKVLTEITQAAKPVEACEEESANISSSSSKAVLITQGRTD